MKKAIVLLVEDNRMDVELTLDAFKQMCLDNQIQVATTGEEALDYLLGREKYGDREAHPLPDLILLDIKLPGISGLDVLQTIKKTPVIKRIPVVILTSSAEERDRIASYDGGANSYLVKPVSFEQFMNVITTLGDYWLSTNVEPPLE